MNHLGGKKCWCSCHNSSSGWKCYTQASHKSHTLSTKLIMSHHHFLGEMFVRLSSNSSMSFFVMMPAQCQLSDVNVMLICEVTWTQSCAWDDHINDTTTTLIRITGGICTKFGAQDDSQPIKFLNFPLAPSPGHYFSDKLTFIPSSGN